MFSASASRVAFIRSCPIQLQQPRFCPNSSEHTSTKLVYLTSTTQSIVREIKSSASWFRKFYKSLLSRIIGFAKVTSIEIITNLIAEYAELEEEDVQDINWKMKELISGETLFEDFVEQIEWNKESVAVYSPYSPSQIFYGARKHRKMRAIPRRLSRMVSQTRAQ